jgi:hypothetical protein
MDFSVSLTEGKVTVTFPAKGLWEVRVFATAGGHSFQQSRRIVVP